MEYSQCTKKATHMFQMTINNKYNETFYICEEHVCPDMNAQEIKGNIEMQCQGINYNLDGSTVR